MSINRTIEVINHELLSTKSELSAWFNKDISSLKYAPIRGWSIEQILEHITITNHFLFILIRKAKIKALHAALKEDLLSELSRYEYNLDQLDDIAVHGSFSWIRPDHMEPTGNVTHDEIRRKLEEQFDECSRILNEIRQGEGILYKTMMSVNNLGKMDVYQYIYFLCQHAKRHIQQMLKVEAEFMSLKETE
ncbi:DinB family protein [Paenibacillus sepulcri]|uniref:DinB family protein n=1 Tax=Paenibacillus sepulcri TaxID=359917 RepID=UPI0035EC8B1C